MRHRPIIAEDDSDSPKLGFFAPLANWVGWLLVVLVTLLGMSACIGLYENPHNHNSPLIGYAIFAVIAAAVVFTARGGPAHWVATWCFLLSPDFRSRAYERWSHVPRGMVEREVIFAVFSFVVVNLLLGWALWLLVPGS